MVSEAESEAIAAAKKAERMQRKIPNAVLGGQPIGVCDCGARFVYGWPKNDVSNMDPCPECGSREWEKWGYRYNGEEIRRDEAWDRYDKPSTGNDQGGDQ